LADQAWWALGIYMAREIAAQGWML
jgi:hypothetical protein